MVDHVRAHRVWRHVCYKNGQIPADAALDTARLVQKSTSAVVSPEDQEEGCMQTVEPDGRVDSC